MIPAWAKAVFETHEITQQREAKRDRFAGKVACGCKFCRLYREVRDEQVVMPEQIAKPLEQCRQVLRKMRPVVERAVVHTDDCAKTIYRYEHPGRYACTCSREGLLAEIDKALGEEE